jgi:hypothetical protein
MIQNGELPGPDLIAMADMSPFEDETLKHVQNVAMPIANELGIEFKIARPKETLYEKLMRGKVVTPFWFLGERKPSLVARRSCTFDFKVELINNLIPRRMWATIWLGISADELKRVRDEDEKLTWGRMRTNFYPLIAKDMTRNDCIRYIAKSGYLMPPKSACDICPFSSKQRLLSNIARDNGTYERIKEIESAWHETPKHSHKYLTQYLDKLPTVQEASRLIIGDTQSDNSGTCGVCEF